eukprot:Pgem_evm1s9012
MVIQFLKPNHSYSLWGSTIVSVPWLVALILLSSFPLALLGWVYESKRLKRPCFHIKNPYYRVPFYAVGAILEAGNQIANSFSITSLDIVFHSLLKLSALVLSVVLFKLFTNKNFNVVHYLGFFVIMASIVFLIAGGNSDPHEDQATFTKGIISGISAAAFSACQ